MINLYRKICPACNKEMIAEMGRACSLIECSLHYQLSIFSRILENFYFNSILIQNSKNGITYYPDCFNTGINLKFKHVFGITNNLPEEIELIKLLT